MHGISAIVGLTFLGVGILLVASYAIELLLLYCDISSLKNADYFGKKVLISESERKFKKTRWLLLASVAISFFGVFIMNP